jgi:membrane protein YdbS with pleckstrin-like domain
MSTTLTFNEERKLVKRRLIHKRKIEAERRKTTQRVGSSQRATNIYNLALDLLGSVLAVVVGIMVLFFTGLLSGASSSVVQIFLVAAIVYVYVVIFRRAFYT